MDPTNPLALFIPGMCAISNLQQSIEADFIGIKIGDVNESAEVNGIKQENQKPDIILPLKQKTDLLKQEKNLYLM